MKEFSELQKDALVEICNVGMAKAAVQLSSLLETTVELTIPEVKLSPAKDLISEVDIHHTDRITYVSQKIGGSLSGTIVVMYEGKELSDSLSGLVLGGINNIKDSEARACEIEAVVEISNVIISSCISNIANFLSLKLNISVPQYAEDILAESFLNIMSDAELPTDKTIGFITKLKAQENGADGILMMFLDEVSVSTLLKCIDEMLGV